MKQTKPTKKKSTKKTLDVAEDYSPGDSAISPEGGENIDDVSDVSPHSLRNLALQASDWTTETIVAQVEKGHFDFRPKFQRRGVWSDVRKSLFIESLILGLPIPQLVLAERRDAKGHFVVIDGKQRLLSMLHFVRPELGGFDKPLVLQKVLLRKQLNGQTLKSMQADPSLAKELASFENQPIRTVVIRNLADENLLFNIFLRLNTGSVPLSTQELRQALHPGLFVDFAYDYSTSSGALRDIFGPEPDFRMRDTELLIRFFAFKNFLGIYKGNLKLFLDNACKALNEQWETSEEAIRHQASDFEAAHQVIVKVFAGNAYRKYTKDGYEARTNRAVFDIMIYYFSLARVRKAVTTTATVRIKAAFEKLCLTNQDFIDSLTTTTKSTTATRTRFDIWRKALAKSLGRAPLFLTDVDSLNTR